MTIIGQYGSGTPGAPAFSSTAGGNVANGFDPAFATDASGNVTGLVGPGGIIIPLPPYPSNESFASIYHYMTPAQAVEANAGTFITDMTPVVQAAIDDGVKDLYFNGAKIYMTGSANMVSGLHVHGPGEVRIPGGTSQYPFYARAGASNPTTDFMTNIGIDGMTFSCATPSATFVNQMALKAVNVRGLRFTGNTCSKMGGVYLTHAIRQNGLYNLASGSLTVDPAVVAGLSATDTNDLNEDFIISDNVIDNTVYGIAGIRTEFCKRGVVSKNTCKYAAISSWGGSAVSTEGGNIQFLRRAIEVKYTGNHSQLSNGAIYLICGESCTIDGNTALNIIDVAFDLEGCFNCAVGVNTAWNAGNYLYSEFYISRNNKFTGNVGIQDGTATGINVANGTSQYAPNLGTGFFSIKGSGFSGVDLRQDANVSENSFQWTGASGCGLVDFAAFSSLTFNGNRMENVAFNATINQQTGRIVFKHNQMLFTQDAVAAALIDLGTINSAFIGAEVENNTIKVNAVQTAGTVGIRATATTGGRDLLYVIKNNDILEDIASALTYGIQISAAAASSVGTRRHRFFIENNIAESFNNATTLDGNGLIFAKGNKSKSGLPLITGDAAPTAWGWIRGSQLPLSSFATGAAAYLEAEKTGFSTSAQWTISTAYTVGQTVWNTASAVQRVYICTTSGTSAGSGAGPTGTSLTASITDNTAVWRYIGDRVAWPALGAVTSPVVTSYLTPGSFTYTVPAAAKFIRVIGIGAGGPGGGGASVAASTACSGGASGGGGGAFDQIFTPSQLTGTVALVIPAAVTGGAGATSGAGDGATSARGSNTTFGGYATGYAAGAGSGGSSTRASAGGGGASAIAQGSDASGATGGSGSAPATSGTTGASTTGGFMGGSGGTGCTNAGVPTNGSYGTYGGASGGAGAGITSGNSAANGGLGRSINNTASPAAGTSGGGNGTDGSNSTGVGPIGSQSGSGGGSSTTTAGGNGGNGGYGCGGGGGGAAQTGFAGGNGGNGGQGAMWIFEYY